jgi:RING finger protein 113A
MEKRSSDDTVTQIYYSNREVVPQTYAGDATHTSEVDTDISKDARAILERNIMLNESGALDGEQSIYRGQAGYKNFIQKDAAQIGANKYTGTQGPIRAPAFVRSTARFDYQPDICKDYKETGFCGYGDQCKYVDAWQVLCTVHLRVLCARFLHDRGDYKSGWQLEKEWDAEQSKKKKRLEDSLAAFESGAGEAPMNEEGEEDYSIDVDDALPFACHLCRGDFTNPVVTLCGHYFCQRCILDKSKEDEHCPICNKHTSGVFNKAVKLVKHLAAKSCGVMSSEPQVMMRPGGSKGAWESIE